MTDENILQRINDGSLVVDLHEPSVTSISQLGATRLRVKEHESNGSSYRFVEVTFKGKKKKIALHRLVWIAANQQLPPEGCDIDHINGQADSIENLRLLPQSINRSSTSRAELQPAF